MTVRPNDKVLYVGMNKYAAHEGASLQKVAKADVTVVKDSFGDDKVKVKVGRQLKTFDLTKDADVAGFVKTLGLPQATADKIAEVIKKAGPDAKDELAAIAQVWAKGELGGEVPNRLVLAGHNVGNGIYGNEDKGKWTNGTLTKELVTELAQAMPNAAAQVEDLAISACFCGGESSVNSWKAGFPNVKTALVYEGLSPGSYNGATRHQAVWEKQTRGHNVDITPENFKGKPGAAGADKDANVAIWNSRDGYLSSTPWEPTADVRARRTGFAADLAKYKSGETPTPTNTNSSPLRSHYRDLHQLLNRSEVTGAERQAITDEKDLTIRLIKYPKLAEKFESVHRAAIKAGYESLGLTVPKPGFEKMTRKEAVDAIAGFETALAAANPKPAAAKELSTLLTEGLRDLKRDRIPDGWIG
ncbi:MAG: hypothetical protein JNK82_08750 [Myxococcaceae bacterium]|nr:hypothetical protein [Myxococcaceae bacterium]